MHFEGISLIFGSGSRSCDSIEKVEVKIDCFGKYFDIINVWDNLFEFFIFLDATSWQPSTDDEATYTVKKPFLVCKAGSNYSYMCVSTVIHDQP